MESKNFKSAECAVITVDGGMVHLDRTWNPDASACQEDETGETIQMEEYSPHGWNVPKDEPRLATDFWGLWSEENGKVLGGITLYDGCTYAGCEAEIASLPMVSPADIAGLADGTYSVYAPIA